MVLLVHPVGNANVRAVLAALEGAGLLAEFVTTVGWSRQAKFRRLLPAAVQNKLARREYDIAASKLKLRPQRELVRLFSGLTAVTEHERGWASADAVLGDLDRFAAGCLARSSRSNAIDAVYAYEDCAEQLFLAARDRQVRRVYELPIAYWETTQRLLREEAERWPEWEPTLGGTRDSAAKLERKTRELELAELVICPSAFVLDSIPVKAKTERRCVVIPFGSPKVRTSGASGSNSTAGKLRVLFAGAMGQRKGLADLFAAMKLVDSAQIELVVMGSLLRPIEWYRSQCPAFRYEPPRPHAEVLRLMQSCDIFVLPSIVEGRALVQQEAMACGLPLIATRNAGADDLISDGETGFLVPIRSPDALAEKINWCATHRASISGMGIAAQERARQLTWHSYGQSVLAAINALTGK
jgi:glycosyltransferase involved in cell wall biosynthesis